MINRKPQPKSGLERLQTVNGWHNIEGLMFNMGNSLAHPYFHIASRSSNNGSQ